MLTSSSNTINHINTLHRYVCCLNLKQTPLSSSLRIKPCRFLSVVGHYEKPFWFSLLQKVFLEHNILHRENNMQLNERSPSVYFG